MSAIVRGHKQEEAASNQTLCCGVKQNQVTGVFLTIISLLAFATAAWLFSGFGTIPAYMTGGGLTVGAIGLLAVSVALLIRPYFNT